MIEHYYFFVKFGLEEKTLPYERTDLDISKGGEGGENRYIIFFFDVESPTPYCVCVPFAIAAATRREREENAGSTR